MGRRLDLHVGEPVFLGEALVAAPVVSDESFAALKERQHPIGLLPALLTQADDFGDHVVAPVDRPKGHHLVHRVDRAAPAHLACPGHLARPGSLEVDPKGFPVEFDSPGKLDSTEPFRQGGLHLMAKLESLRGAYPACRGGLADRQPMEFAGDEPQPDGGGFLRRFGRAVSARPQRFAASGAKPFPMAVVGAVPPHGGSRNSGIAAFPLRRRRVGRSARVPLRRESRASPPPHRPAFGPRGLSVLLSP